MDSKVDKWVYRIFLLVISLICLYFYFHKFLVVRIIAENYFPDKPHPIKWPEAFLGLITIVFFLETIFLIIWNYFKNLRSRK